MGAGLIYLGLLWVAATLLSLRLKHVPILAGFMLYLLGGVALVFCGFPVGPLVPLAWGLTALTVLLFRGPPNQDSSRHRSARAVLIFLGVVYSLSLMTFSPFGLVITLMFLAALIRGAFIARRTRQIRIVSNLRACVERNLPFETVLPVHMGQRRDKEARILTSLASYLSIGLSVRESLRRAWPGCPGEVMGAVAAAEPVGKLGPALAGVEAEMLDRRRGRGPSVSTSFSYLAVVLFVILALLFLLTCFVLPKFSRIWHDFAIVASPQVQLLLDLEKTGPLLLAVVLLAMVLIGLFALVMAIRPRRPGSLSMFSLIRDAVVWVTPVARGLDRDRGLQRVCGALRMGLDAGCTLDEAIAAASRQDVNACLCVRLRRWRRRVLNGEDAAASAKAERLGSPLAWAFDAKVNPGNAAEVLLMLTDYYGNRCRHRAAVLTAVAVPVLTLTLAVCVGAVVVLLYSPLVGLIEGTLENTQL